MIFFWFIQIQRYFDTLPEDKVPKIGSTGERHREKQLAYQLPKQDLSLSYCKHIEPQNQSSYEDFVAARNEIALDIGMNLTDIAHIWSDMSITYLIRL